TGATGPTAARLSRRCSTACPRRRNTSSPAATPPASTGSPRPPCASRRWRARRAETGSEFEVRTSQLGPGTSNFEHRTPNSARRPAAVGDEHLAGDVVGLVRGEEEGRVGDILGLADAAPGD